MIKWKNIYNSSVIRQNCESQNGCFNKTKHATRTCAYQRVRNVRFFRKFGVLCFVETTVLRFVLSPYYRRIYDKINFMAPFYGQNSTASRVQSRYEETLQFLPLIYPHWVKIVQIQSYFWSIFSCIRTECRVNLRIQSECRKIWTRNNSIFGHFSRSATDI